MDELRVMENQYHPLWGIPNLGGLDCHEYVLDWLQGVFSGSLRPTHKGRICYVKEQGDGPWGKYDWKPSTGPRQPYF